MFDLDRVSIIAIATGSILFFLRRSLRYMRYFQQEEYYPDRFTRWWLEKRAFDSRGTVVAITAGLATLGVAELNLPLALPISIVAAAILGIIAFREEDPRKVGKLTLKMTQRVTRIYRLALVIYTIAILLVAAGFFHNASPVAVGWFWLVQIIFFQTTFAWLIAANGILWPGEKRIQDGFMQEAKAILGKVDP
ncbi:MAG TPA: hypothetical protein DCY88_29720, partial [Cyanobacteria bacterium UBA11372]|nr:hypothetical protein [Cyanobacteria bacterium UBA11372]